MTSPTPGLRRLALWTCVATFLLVVVGGIVRVSDSGLGCGPKGSGLDGWPFCKGDVVPGLNLHTIIEYSHRTVAGIVVILIAALVVQGWRRYRGNAALTWGPTLALVLVISQAVLGGATVEKGLDEGLVAAHLGLAMLLLGVLIYVWRATASRQPPVARRQELGRGFRPLAIAASVLVLCTIVAGGYMAGTQKYGTANYQVGDGAHHACGKQFPTCNGDFLPFGQSRLVNIHLVHRAFMYLAVLAVLALVALTLRRRPSEGLVRSAKLLALLLVGQVLLGAVNVWLDEHEILIAAHLALGTLLWAASVGLTLQLFRVPAPSPAKARAEAVPA